MTMYKPLISIIVPIYKVEKYLKKCIQSIMNQTYLNFELILVDDGSPDDCPMICDNYAKLDNRIVVLHKQNGGLSDARNAGLDVARGEYIGFVDSDDFIANNMYEKLLSGLLAEDADMAVCNFSYVDENYRFLDKRNLSMPVVNERLDLNEYIERMMGKCGWYFVPAWNKLYKRKLFDKLRYPVGKQHEDEFLIHHLIYRCKYITCIEDSLYYYVQRQGSIMSQKTKIKMMDYGEALLDRYYFAKAKKNDILKEWAVKQLVYEMGKWESYACSDKLCKKKYLELKKKTYPILFDKTLWSNYSMFGRIITKLQLVEPKLANWILSKFQK